VQNSIHQNIYGKSLAITNTEVQLSTTIIENPEMLKYQQERQHSAQANAGAASAGPESSAPKVNSVMNGESLEDIRKVNEQSIGWCGFGSGKVFFFEKYSGYRYLIFFVGESEPQSHNPEQPDGFYLNLLKTVTDRKWNILNNLRDESPAERSSSYSDVRDVFKPLRTEADLTFFGAEIPQLFPFLTEPFEEAGGDEDGRRKKTNHTALYCSARHGVREPTPPSPQTFTIVCRFQPLRLFLWKAKS